MKKFNSRRRIILLTSVLTLLYLVFQETDFRTLLNIDLNFDPIKPVILAIGAYLGTYWALFFRVKGERFITILMYPAITVFAFSLFTELVIATVLNNFGQIGILALSTLAFWVFTYLTLLTVNILNAAYVAEIPLGQAARAAQFVLTLVTGYISYFLLFSNDFYVILRAIALFILNAALVFITLSAIKLRIRQRVVASLNIGLLLGFIGFVLSIWPVSPPYLALTLSLLLYICLGISLEIREFINRWVWIEYITLFFLIVFMLIFVAEWGINGVLI